MAVLAVSDDRQVLASAIAATSGGASGHLAVHLPGQPTAGLSRAVANDISLVQVHRRSDHRPGVRRAGLPSAGGARRRPHRGGRGVRTLC